MAVPEPTPDELRALTARLRRAAMHSGIRIPGRDAEDVAQDALLKLVREQPSENPPPLVVRALAALKQAKVDYVRRRNRAKEPPLEALADYEGLGRADAGLRLFELEETLRHEVGTDALEVARAKVAGRTEAEVAAQPGWTTQRAGAARRRLQRGADRVRDELRDE